MMAGAVFQSLIRVMKCREKKSQLPKRATHGRQGCKVAVRGPRSGDLGAGNIKSEAVAFF